MSSTVNSTNSAATTPPASATAATPSNGEKVPADVGRAAAGSPSGAPATTAAPRKTSPAALPQQQAPAVNGSSTKAAKPRPLKLSNQVGVPLLAGGHHGGGGLLGHHPNVVYASFGNPQSASVHYGGGSSPHHHTAETVSTDEMLDLMEHINKAVKASQFSPNLAGQIFKLYNQLKTCGEGLEQSNRAELNRVFVSLRQACCRDSGQLGTPCRLKMMELVELRAMGWRPNLAHSQYYMTRSTTTANGAGGMTSPDFHHGDPMTGGELEQLGAAPVSAPPFGAVPINPFAFNMPAPMPSAADIVSANQALGQPSYYLIPAAHMGHPPGGITFVGPPSSAGMMPPPPPQPMMTHHHPLTATYSTPAVLTSMALHNASPPMTFRGQAAAAKPATKFSRPTKVPGKNQFRDEVVIRNADSGKIMGVKGRRVALIEEISKTVISFQKVPQGAKERTLTVTGPSEESIIQAKILIEDTIRRNVSPVRADGQSGELLSHADAISEGDSDEVYENGDNLSTSTNHETDSAVAELESILKQNCADPEVLKAAGAALKMYLQRHEHQRHEPLRRSATDAYVKHRDKERRKSMPLPILTNVPEAVESELANPNVKTAEDVQTEQLAAATANAKLKLSARSTPNLLAGERRSVLKPCAVGLGSKSAPSSLPTISEQLTDIVPSGREPFDPSIYKQKVVEFKQTRV